MPDPAIAHRDRIAAALGDVTFQPQRHRVARCLGERWREIDAGAPQAGLERPGRRVTVRVDRQLPVGRTGYSLGHRDLRKFDAELGEVGGPLPADVDVAHAARDRQPRRPTQNLGGELLRAHVMLGERELAAQLIEHRHRSGELEAIARKRVFAVDVRGA